MTKYRADGHEAQMKILRHLLMSNGASFADLRRACDLSSDHANFHIKQLINAGFVSHVAKSYGRYTLTRTGKEYANRMDTDEYVIEKQPKLSVVLMIENNDGLYLTQQRLKHPYYGYWGHITGKIRWGETMIGAGLRELREETGISADLRIVGFIHKLDYDVDNQLLEDKYLCLMHGINPVGELIEVMEGHTNAWMSAADYDATEKNYGPLDDVYTMIKSNMVVVTEKTYTYPMTDY